MKKCTLCSILLVFCLCFSLLTCPAASYVVAYCIHQGGTIFIGEQGLNLTTAQYATYYGPGSLVPLVTPSVDQDTATIGWWPSAAVIGTNPPTKTISLIGRNTSFYVAPADFDGYTGNWYIVNQSLGFADTPAIFTVSDPSLDLQVWNFNSASDVSGTSVLRGQPLGFRIATNMYAALDYPNRCPIENSTSDGYMDIIVKNQSGVYTSLYNGSLLSNTLLQHNVSTQPWTWGNAPSAPFNWSTGVLSGGLYVYSTGNYSIHAESQLNGMKDNYKNAGADYTGKTVSQTEFIILYDTPFADFTGTPTAGTAPLAVTFTDTSTNTPTSWNWSFGDGVISTLQNPSHTYTTTGTYTVALNATNAAGSNTTTRAAYITVTIPPLPPTTASSSDDDGGGAPAPQQKEEPPAPAVQLPEVQQQQLPVAQQQPAPTTPELAPVEGLAGVTVIENYPVGYAGLSYNTVGDNTVSIDLDSARDAGAVVTVYFDRVTSYQHNSPGVLITFWGDRFQTRDGKITGEVDRAELQTDPLVVNVSGGKVAGSMKAELFSIGQPVEVENAITGNIPLSTAVQYNALLAPQNRSVAGIAYLMKFQRGNLTSTGAANVTMTVPSSWVDQHGGKEAVRITRTSDETGTTELLATTFEGTEPGGNMVFRGDSPHGTSLFGLITSQATTAEKKAHPNVTYIPASKPAMITNVGMFGWIVESVRENPVLVVLLFAVIGAIIYLGWWKRRL